MCCPNRNILAAFLFVATNGVTYSIWGSPLLPLFIQVFTGDTATSVQFVGIAEGVQGAVQCLCALISGVLADKLSRHIVLKAAGVAQVLAASMTLFAVYFGRIFPNAAPSNSNASAMYGGFADGGYHPYEDAAAATSHYIPLHYVGMGPVGQLGQLGPGANLTCASNTTYANATGLSTAPPVAPFNKQGNVQWYLLCASCGMWGVYSGLYGPSMEALFADSIMTGQRAKYYTLRQVVLTTARATGPLLALVAFYLLNDQWTLPTLTWVLTGGLVLTVVPSTVLCMFHDKYTLGLKNEAITATRKTIERRQKQAAGATTTAATVTITSTATGGDSSDGQEAAGGEGTAGKLPTAAGHDGDDGLTPVDEVVEEEDGDDDDDDDDGEDEFADLPAERSSPKSAGRAQPQELVDPLSDTGGGEASAVGGNKRGSSEGAEGGGDNGGDGSNDDHDDNNESEEDGGSCCCRCCAGTRAIPWVILASNTVTGFATGMTVKFFPVFFKNAVCLTPAMVNIIYAVTPFVQALATYASRYPAKKIGRVWTVQLQRMAGTLCLFLMAWRTELWTQPWVIVPLYVVRTILTSCGWPLMNSVLNDYTAKKHRAKFNSMQSIAGFGWSFSALAGGFIISAFPNDEGSGFSLVFYITCALQVVTLALRFFVIPMMPRKEITTDHAQGVVADGDDVQDDATLGVDDGVAVQTPTEKMGGTREERRRVHAAAAADGELSEPLLPDGEGGGAGAHSGVITDPSDPRYGYGGGRPGAKPRHGRASRSRSGSGSGSDRDSTSSSSSLIYTYREDSGGANV